MADFIKLADGTIYQIEEGASLGNIIVVVQSGQDGISVSKKFTSENVAHVEFYTNLEQASDVPSAEASGVYNDIKINSVYFDVNNMQVLVSLAEKSEIELRLDAIESEQEMQNEAIDFLAMEA